MVRLAHCGGGPAAAHAGQHPQCVFSTPLPQPAAGGFAHGLDGVFVPQFLTLLHHRCASSGAQPKPMPASLPYMSVISWQEHFHAVQLTGPAGVLGLKQSCENRCARISGPLSSRRG